jgi:hypothetical protein
MVYFRARWAIGVGMMLVICMILITESQKTSNKMVHGRHSNYCKLAHPF